MLTVEGRLSLCLTGRADCGPHRVAREGRGQSHRVRQEDQEVWYQEVVGRERSALGRGELELGGLKEARAG